MINNNHNCIVKEVLPMQKVQAVKEELAQYQDPQKAEFLLRYFKATPGGYGEGDSFIGVKVPYQRKVARKFYKNVTLEDIETLLREPVHEYRLTAIFLLVLKYEKARSEEEKKSIVDLYLNNCSYVNNWDLVDASAEYILGPYLLERDREILYRFARSGHLWQQRIAVMTTHYFIRNGQFEDTFNIASILLKHEHDLIHKAVGWMLREVGKRDFEAAFNFLKEHYREMPRTMLRYAIEKYDEELRQKFLKGQV
jgi:3-methyladenine DNA glycosylase AlkD